MLKIILDEREVGCEDAYIGNIHYEATLDNDATGLDVINAIIKVMRVAEYHPNTIKRALEEALEDFTENKEKNLNDATE